MPPVWHTGQLNLEFRYISLHSYSFCKLVFYILLYRLPTDWDTPGAPTPPPINLQCQKRSAWTAPTIDFYGVPPEGSGDRSTVEPMQVDTGHIFEDPDQMLMYFTRPIRHGADPPSPPHGAIITPAAALPRIISWELPHP